MYVAEGCSRRCINDTGVSSRQVTLYVAMATPQSVISHLSLLVPQLLHILLDYRST